MMETTDDQKKRECWEEFCKSNGLYDQVHVLVPTAFIFAFDRAYALGREKETITQEDVEKASLKYILNRQQARHDAKGEEASLSDFDNTLKAWDAFDMAQAYEDGANFALGKQEKNRRQTPDPEYPSGDSLPKSKHRQPGPVKLS